MSVSDLLGMNKKIRKRFDMMREQFLGYLLDVTDRLAGTISNTPYRQRQSYVDVNPIGIAIVGCGFVADFYGRTLGRHAGLKLIGVTDRDASRANRFAARHSVEVFPSLNALLEDHRIEIVVNLTNPVSHFEVSKACLEAGKHVYSEKPLAMVQSEAEELVAIAEDRGLRLSSAPCSILGETAQVLGEALRREEVGRVRLVYAELDDGPIHQMLPQEWASPEGTPWPWKDEFSVGCTLEHAGYFLTWLVAFFGPAQSVSAFSACLISEKHTELAPHDTAPDFSVGCIRFESGVVARLTCSIVAPHDHSLRIIGDKGVLSVDECWHNSAPVRVRRFTPFGLRAETYAWLGRHWLTRSLYGLDGKTYPRSSRPDWRSRLRRHEMDYVIGVAELAAAIREDRPSRLSARFGLHVNELTLAIQGVGGARSPYRMKSTLSQSDLDTVLKRA